MGDCDLFTTWATLYFTFQLRRLTHKVIMNHWLGPIVQQDLPIRVMAERAKLRMCFLPAAGIHRLSRGAEVSLLSFL